MTMNHEGGAVTPDQGAAWPITKVTAPYLRQPGVYWVVICDDRPYSSTFSDEVLAAEEVKRRGDHWVETVIINSITRIRPKVVQVYWNTRRLRSDYHGRCLVCGKIFSVGTDIVSVYDPEQRREGWSHTPCAEALTKRG